jgi:RNA polymerase sigma factor (sigma-70 family)
MKKYRKQGVFVYGKKRLADVPVDSELYKADNREEYQRARSRAKHVPLDSALISSITADIAEAYEEAQLLEALRDALLILTEAERRLIECIYYDGLNDRETAAKLKLPRSTVNWQKNQIIKKLRNILKDWI